ncbi:cation/H(+) antiporter 20 [Ricinus communis]|uniref:cation/H(+) antiporter 20 n=1 Tax=Ricinus communis TaxID=3988 RepID=UPI00077253D1|nr:cation/H(+) antiporter 20 [Ricinus communis]|eukprot:XP_015580000.1 cation/H(+) antiporter 20 [Ricinus communis]
MSPKAMSMALNLTTIKTSSDGVWQGDNPLNYAFPLLILQTIIVLSITRFLAFLFKPLRQPRVLAEIIGGILLGPSALGRNESFSHLVFPSWSTPILESVASLGLLFFLFLVGLELDVSSIRRTGRTAFCIALAGISLPFLFGVGVSFLLRKAVHGMDKVGYGQYLMFMGIALSITAFPVLARILAELKLLTTQMGQTAMAAAAFNDLAAWILLALAVALAGNGSGGDHTSSNPLTAVWVLLSGVAFIAFMLIFVRPMMDWVARRCSRQQDVVDEAYICLTLAGVMLSGFMTDLIGIHSIFGAFVFGLMIPKGGEFPERLIKRIEDFVSGLLLPLYFASSGLKTDVATIQGVEAWGLLLLVTSTACAGKVLGTFLVAMLCMIPARESLTLGVLMNTKGLVELIVLNIGREKKVLNDEMFAILVLMALFTTFLTTPTVMALHKPLRQTFRAEKKSSTLENSQATSKILACIHGLGNIPALIDLIESTRSAKRSLLKLYVMQLVELTDRSSSIMMAQRSRKNGFPFINRFSRGSPNDQLATAFKAYSCVSRIKIRNSVSVSALSSMHEDICHLAENKGVEMIILPFHKQWREGEKNEDDGSGWRGVNKNVLETAPCSIAMLVDLGIGGKDHITGLTTTLLRKVCILFFGGPDDRKALEVGGWMADHPSTIMTLIRFREQYALECRDTLKETDEVAVAEFRRKWNGSVEYIEKDAKNIRQEMQNIGQKMDFNLLIVGKGARVAELADVQAEHPELGHIGGILVSSESEHGMAGSILVIQQNNPANASENLPKLAKYKETMNV